MKYLIFAILSLPISLLGQDSSITGKWDAQTKGIIMEIYSSTNDLEGKVVSSEDKKAKPGMLVIRNLKESNGVWKGEFYVPRFGGTWMNVKMEPLNQFTMNVTVSNWLMKKTKVWKKVN